MNCKSNSARCAGGRDGMHERKNETFCGGPGGGGGVSLD